MEFSGYKKNDIVTVNIEDIGNDGEGIGRADGYTLFIKDAVIGDTVKAQITKCGKNYGYARVEKVVTPSPFRVSPKCAFHRQCGGCQIQAMQYERQLVWKENKVRENLMRIGGFAAERINVVMEHIAGMEEPWHYRNKAQFPIGYDRDGNLIAGFYAGRTHDIIANTDCLLGPAENREILEAVLSYMKALHIYRLPALARTSDNQRVGCGGFGYNPAAKRVLRHGGRQPAYEHNRARQAAFKPQPRHRGGGYHHVRRKGVGFEADCRGD